MNAKQVAALRARLPNVGEAELLEAVSSLLADRDTLDWCLSRMTAAIYGCHHCGEGEQETNPGGPCWWCGRAMPHPVSQRMREAAGRQARRGE